MFSIDGIDRIYSKQTKEYFKEVLSTYFSGNYRSSIVLLYSVVIFDLCSKLSELENSYNDGAAKQILEEAKARNASDQPWEKLLIESTYSRGIIEKKLFSDIDHLYSDRCFSAHPSLEGNFELQTPSKETTIAHIKNMLNGLFTSPPTFNKNLINIITNDIEQRKEVLNDFDKLRSYLDRSYYSRMTQPARIAFFRSLWSFCFNKPDDSRCEKNSEINRKALAALCFSSKTILDDAKNNGFLFTFSNEKWCPSNLCLFLSSVNIVPYLKADDVAMIKLFSSKSRDLEFVSWNLFDSFTAFQQHLEDIITNCSQIILGEDTILRLKDKYASEGKINEFLDLNIKLFNSCNDFYSTLTIYNKYIRPNLIDFSIIQLDKILTIAEGNKAIFDSYYFNPSEIFVVYKNKKGERPELSNYPHLKKRFESFGKENGDSTSDKKTKE